MTVRNGSRPIARAFGQLQCPAPLSSNGRSSFVTAAVMKCAISANDENGSKQ